MCTNQDLETRVVILEAALTWVRHEARSRAADPRAMERIAAIASQVLEEDERAMTTRMHRYNVEYNVEPDAEAALRAG